MVKHPTSWLDTFKHIFVLTIFQHQYLSITGLTVCKTATTLCQLNLSTKTNSRKRVLTIEIKSTIESFYIKIIFRPSIHTMHIEHGLIINYIAIIKLFRLNTVSYYVTIGTRYRFPNHIRLTTIFRITQGHKLLDLLNLHLRCSTKYPEILDTELGPIISGYINNFHELCLNRSLKLIIIMFQFLFILRFAYYLGPICIVVRYKHLIALI